MTAPGATSKNAVKIALVGPPGSGKTTYLAALAAAARDRRISSNGSWGIWPVTAESSAFLSRLEKDLVEDLKFPEATSASAKLEWVFAGNLAGSKFDHRVLGRGRELNSRFALDIVDAYGGDYGGDLEHGQAASEVGSVALDHLDQAEGIIYMFDPIRERDKGDAIAYLRGTLNYLKWRAVQNGREPSRYLPHQISVCVTKFDDPLIFERAREMSMVHMAHDGEMPRVLDKNAEQFFEEVCNGKFWGEPIQAGGQRTQFLLDEIKHEFRAKHIRYFVTSSIGFWMQTPVGDHHDGHWIDLDDPYNFLPREGKIGLRGEVHPVNVLEPLIDLQRRITRDRR